MNIAIDVSPLKTGHFLQHRVRGTGFYLENLKKSLEQYFPENIYTYFSRGESIDGQIDVVHYPYFEPFFLTLPFFPSQRSVVTVHDLTPLRFPSHFPPGIKGALKWRLQKMALRRQVAVITDSVSSKKDIHMYTGIPNEKIHVIYLAAGEEYKKKNMTEKSRKELREKYNLPEKFALYVGDVTWNKNLPRLMEAIRKSNVPLVCVGKAIQQKNVDENNPWNKDLVTVQRMIKQTNTIQTIGFVPTEDLVGLYNIATVFIMPSLYEGFGLPVLEAMSCGCPVITTKEGSLPEVAGGAAYYVDALDVDNIAEGIQEVFHEDSIRNELIHKGLKQAVKFSWEKTVTEMMKVYKHSRKGV